MSLTPITLSAAIESFQGADLYGQSDGLGLQNEYLTYDIALKNVSVQNHSDASTREPLLYNALDIKTGMYISDTSGNTILKIVEIGSKSTGLVECKVEDIDMMSFRLNSQNSIPKEDTVIIFSLNPEGEPTFAGSPFQVEPLQRVLSRFSLNERDDRVKFTHTLDTGLSNGDIVTVNNTGGLVRYGATGGSDIKLGVVVDVYRGGKDVFVKPFNDIIRDYSNPEALTGQPGSVYYTDPNSAGDITTAEGGKAAFMHLNASIPTTVNITSAFQPGAGDTITVNGIEVFNGPAGGTVADAAAFRDVLNSLTSQTHVSAAITQDPGVLNAEGNSMAYAGTFAGQDMTIFANVQGSAPASGNFGACDLSDGNKTARVTFNNPDLTVNYGVIYEYLSPTAIKAAFDNAITTGGLDLTCELYASSDNNGQAIKLTTTGSATGITLTNIYADEFGINVVGDGSATGLSTTASLGASTLTLTRSSGGSIEIDGTPLQGGYINQAGVVSSNSGRVPYLLLIESEGGGSGETPETGIDFKEDFNPNTTTTDEDSAGVAITYTPFSGGNVTVKVNGLQVDLGNGLKDEPCYFSADGGATAKAWGSVEAGDVLYWMGSIAGYELEPSDEVDLIYEKSFND
jgi:hypothetical protein